MDANHQTAQAPTRGLTIGDLAHRTGVAAATLRAWESRHGFPRPRRLESGHRRYDEQDVELVRQVMRRKDAGVRLETAIAEAAAVRPSPAASVFAELRRRHPHLAPQRLRKSTLMGLSFAMEDECCARAQQPLLFAAFQHERFYRHARRRWDELTRTARRAVVFADFAGTPAGWGPGDGTTLVHLPGDVPLRREWALVCDSADHRAALAAWELPGQNGVRDLDRRFESVWTLEPNAVRDAARACAELVGQLAPEHAEGFEDLDDAPPEPSADLRTATSMFARLVTYLDMGDRIRWQPADVS